MSVMTRQGFLGAILGAPFLGWVTKLDYRGDPTLRAIEPVASAPTIWVQNNDTPSSQVVTYSADDSATLRFANGEVVQSTRTIGAP
jgi:hypothetical protein